MRTLAVCLLVIGLGAAAGAQSRRQPATTVEPAAMACRHELGVGVKTGARFCDIWAGRTAADGAVITLPARRGPAILRFDLHNRQTYSETLVQAGRAFTRTTATIGVLTAENEVLRRAIIRTEFRTAADLYDRVPVEGTTLLKAVAPVGREAIELEIPAGVDSVSLVGEKAEIRRMDSRETVGAPGRPIALVSNVTVEYRPAPAPRRR